MEMDVFSQETFTKTPFSVEYASYVDAEMKKTALAVTFSLALLLSGVGEILSVNFAVAEDAGEILAASPHEILIESPNNYTLYEDSLTLNITVYFLETDGLVAWQSLTLLNYSIDDKPPVNIITSEALLVPPVNSNNVTVSGLTDGQHKMEVTAVFVGNVGNVFLPTYTLTSDLVYFTVNTESQLEPFPATLLIGSIVAVAAVVGLGLLVYLKKSLRNSNQVKSG